MNLKILFISDNGLLHPILRAQGIPQIFRNASDETQFALMTFERGRPQNLEYRALCSELSSRGIIHVPVFLPTNLFPSGRFWVWCLGIVRGAKFCMTYKPQILHARSYPPMLIALVLKALFGAKVIFDMRGIFVDEVVEAGIIRAGTVIHAFERATEKLYMHKADVMVAVSQPHRDYLARLARDPAMAERCYVIPNSTDPAKFERVKPLKGSSMIRLLYVGQHVVKYDMDGVFEFFRVLTQQHPESYLRIVTYGPPQKLVEKIRSLPEAIQKRVEITNADSQDVPDKMNDSSAGMLLLHDTVGNRVSAPIKLAEYLAAGMPIIVSENIGDAETIIKKYGVGVIVRNKEYESAIRTLVNLLDTPDIEKRCRLAIAGDLSMESSCMKYMELYQLLATPIAKKG